MKNILPILLLACTLIVTSCGKDDNSNEVRGCTNQLAENYNPDAMSDDGSCIIKGCTNQQADNYNPNANTDDGSCIVSGCTDPQAENYNPNANIDNDSCIYERDKWIGDWDIELACTNDIISSALGGQVFTIVIAPGTSGVEYVTIKLENDLLPTEGQEIAINGNVVQYNPPAFKIPFGGAEYSTSIKVTLILSSDELSLSGDMLITVNDLPFIGTIVDNCAITGTKK
jgi:hypothetical protein